MVVDGFEQSTVKEYASDELCCFLATLLHGELTTLSLPMLRSTSPETNRTIAQALQSYNHSLDAAAISQLSLAAVNEASHGVRMLINAIEANCSSLKTLHILTLSIYNPLNPLAPLTEDSSLANLFFRALPRLTNLHADCYKCDDWALLQIATHATNLV
jgi:hypothetical protein